MIYVVFFVTLLLNSVKTSTDGGACNETWVDASSVSLGYLWFDTLELMRYENAIKYCQDRNSRLIEIYTQEQMDFTTKKLMPLTGKVLWQTYANGNYRWKAWWGGATDEVEEDTWIWGSGKPLPLDSFVWGTKSDGGYDEPNNINNQDYFCFTINDKSDPKFFGNDCRGSAFPLCQQERY